MTIYWKGEAPAEDGREETMSDTTSAEDLLKAAESTLEYWEATGFAECEDDCDCIVEMTRAAIAKARAETARLILQSAHD